MAEIGAEIPASRLRRAKFRRPPFIHDERRVVTPHSQSSSRRCFKTPAGHVKTVLGVALFTGTVFAKCADAAAPRLIMVYGSPLTKPVILSNWRENLEFMSSITQESSVTPEELRRRPYVKLALFWGPEWAQYVEEGKPIDRLRPEQANQQGRFYPAVGRAGPVVTLDMPPGSVGPSWRQVREAGIRILLKYGIAVRLPP